MATKHQKVSDYIERLILDGSVSPGEVLPGELELSRTLDVSRNTIRHAIAQLSKKYRIERTPGRGTVFLGDAEDTSSARAIGIINSSLMYTIYPELIHGVEDGLYRGGYTMILANGNYDPEKERESIRRMLNQGVAGLIVEPMASAAVTPDNRFITDLNKTGVPIITTNCMIEGLTASYITLDDEQIGRMAAEYLVTQGHSQIGCVYKRDNQAGILRLKGLRAGLEAAGLSLREEYTCGYSQEDEPLVPGAWGTRQIMEQSTEQPTAIFYFNDQIAIQAYEALREDGLTIPEDISIIAVDNISEATHVSPGLTTFNHPKYLMGKIAAEMMLARLGPHNDSLVYGVTMKPELVVRGSVRSIR